MDLRPYNPTPEQIETARHLSCRGLLCYQPFTLSDSLVTGAGYEFAKVAEGAGLVYCENPPHEYRGNASVNRHLIDPALKDEFVDYSRRLSVLYDSMINLVSEKLGGFPGLTVADIGCCSGYFPLAMAKRGAKRAVGYDLVDYRPTFNLLNDILGTNAEFYQRGYDGIVGGLKSNKLVDRIKSRLFGRTKQAETFDVVFSIAVLVHLSDPLQHLAYLGSIAKKALVVWTWTSENEEDQMVIRYGSVNRYYEHAKFPYCFDIMQISPGLLQRSLELMGFTEIHPIRNVPDGMPDYWFDRHRGYLAIRPDAVEDKADTIDEMAPSIFGMADSVPRLVNSHKNYNIVSLRGLFWAVPQSLGSVDLTKTDPRSLPGVLVAKSPEAVMKKIR
jgi:SAM-dependent methyltransferase